ncbi:MAG: hypothetical protein MR938_02505 [Tenericutes bacterium]|nr:hypothetical protein [Mycoplasmatota bacterium]
MEKQDYSAKEIIFGLREECKRVKSEIDKLKSLLTYDDKVYTITASINEENKIYLEAALNIKDLGFLKALRYYLTSNCLVNTVVAKTGENDYTIVFSDKERGMVTFPAYVTDENRKEFNDLITVILNETKQPMFEKEIEYPRLEEMHYTPSVIEINSAVGNIFPYKVKYMGNSDAIRFSSEFEEVSPRIIERVLEAKYDSSILTEKAKKIIDSSDTSKKGISILNYNKLTSSEEYSIEELPNRLILIQKGKRR